MNLFRRKPLVSAPEDEERVQARELLDKTQVGLERLRDRAGTITINIPKTKRGEQRKSPG